MSLRFSTLKAYKCEQEDGCKTDFPSDHQIKIDGAVSIGKKKFCS